MNCQFQRSEEIQAKRVDYAMPADFCRIFDDRLNDLYTLSLSLTADRSKAERCLVAGLEDCLQGNPVFKEWAHSWAKRTVAKNAIRLISPSPSRNETSPANGVPKEDTLAGGVTSLPPFDRFVYVLSVLEKYSDRECSTLLACAVEKVAAARIRALQRLADARPRIGPVEAAPAHVAGALKQFCGEVL